MSFMNCFDMATGRWFTIPSFSATSIPILNPVDNIASTQNVHQNTCSDMPDHNRDIMIRILLRPKPRVSVQTVPIWIQTCSGTEVIEASCESMADSNVISAIPQQTEPPITTDLPEINQSSEELRNVKDASFPSSRFESPNLIQDIDRFETASSLSTISCEESLHQFADAMMSNCPSLDAPIFQTLSDGTYSLPIDSKPKPSPRPSTSTPCAHHPQAINHLTKNSVSLQAKRSQTGKRHVFIYKLFDMLQTGRWSSVKWDNSGKYILCNLKTMQHDLVTFPICRSRQVSSFIRQLHMYGFRRSSTVTSDRRFDHKYFNPNFQRDQPDLLINLNPRKPPKFKIADLKTETLIINDDDDDLYLLNNENNCNAKNTLNSSFSPSKYCKLENELFNFD